ncbi:hypothetical protein FQN54_000583 [Arachnomyces sp. PD_36]|nr:hypothetical protein FQN54_000583 [Arachnomyces sp. PD_36]
MSIPIVDSHIHLFPAAHLPSLSWYTPSSPLGSQHSVAQYRAASSSSYKSTDEPPKDTSRRPSTQLRGFIFVETDRISSLSPSDWHNALDEVSFLARIARGQPIEGEGHVPEDSSLCLGIVPWAPVPAGPEALKEYMALVRERTLTPEVWNKIRGVRYLTQDKPVGTMLGEEFINGLKWLGKEGLTFDLGVDARQGGLIQLREAVEMMKKVYSGVNEGEGVKLVINHLCKPNLHPPSSPTTTHPDFEEWKSLITTMSSFPNTYMKLSGAFSELPSVPTTSQSDLIDTIEPWANAVFDAFGPGRVMFGSDWPVCNVGGGGNGIAWARWRDVVELLLQRKGLSEQAIKGVWGGVAAKAYGVQIDT